jgi:AraC-like DNA-binding protein
MMQQFFLDHVNATHNVSYDVSVKYKLHCHPIYEIYYFISGSVDYLVNGVLYQPKPKSVILMAPGTFHECRVKTAEKYERFTLHFDPGLVPEKIRTQLMQPFHSSSIYLENVDSIFYELNALQACYAYPDELSGPAVNARLVAMLSQILNIYNAFKPPEESAVDMTLPQKIIEHINTNFSQKITLDMLSQQFFMSKNQINRIFTKATGRSVMDYVRHKRIIYAEHLRAMGTPAAEAAYKAGFDNYSTYYRLKQKWKD